MLFKAGLFEGIGVLTFEGLFELVAIIFKFSFKFTEFEACSFAEEAILIWPWVKKASICSWIYWGIQAIKLWIILKVWEITIVFVVEQFY